MTVNFKIYVLQQLVGVLINKIGHDVVGEAIGEALDKIEAKVKATPNQYDDAVVLPVIEVARKVICEPEHS